MNTNLLKSEILLKGERISDMPEKLGISKSAWYRKIQGKTEFTRSEIANMVNILHIEKEKAFEIFFN